MQQLSDYHRNSVKQQLTFLHGVIKTQNFYNKKDVEIASLQRILDNQISQIKVQGNRSNQIDKEDDTPKWQTIKYCKLLRNSIKVGSDDEGPLIEACQLVYTEMEHNIIK